MPAYTYAMFIVLIFVAAVAIAFLAPAMNPFAKFMNKNLAAGTVSTGTYAAFSWNWTILTYIAGISLLGFGAAMVYVTIERTEAGLG